MNLGKTRNRRAGIGNQSASNPDLALIEQDEQVNLSQIGLGDDGPTHQPVEHLAALRAIPGLYVYRPADPIETAECWALALHRRDAPSLLGVDPTSLAVAAA